MTSQNSRTACAFDAAERAWLKKELAPQFGVSPILADGFLLKVWKSGPSKGKPRLPPPVANMVERRLLDVRSTPNGQRAFLTPEGLRELANLFASPRLMDLRQFGDLHLQLDPAIEGSDLDELAAPLTRPATHKSTP